MSSRPHVSRMQRRSAPDSDAATRDALLGAARACVRQHGLAKVTSRMIAAAAAANLGSITYYFGSKDELVAEALFGHLAGQLGPILAVLEDGDGAAPARMVVAVQQLVAEFERSTADLPVFVHALVLSTEPGPLGARGRQLVASLQDRLATLIVQLRCDGVVAGWVQPEAMAALVVASALGMAMHALLDPAGPAVSALAAQLVALLLGASHPT